MIENVQQEVEWAQAARKVSQRAREMAKAEHVTLTDMKWHRGHEVADLDGWWLTLITDNRAITERFPNAAKGYAAPMRSTSTVVTDWRVLPAFAS
jgi:hypothetical protein